MKTLIICSVIGLCFIAQGSSETVIQCYDCYDCDVLSNSLLNTCPLQEVTNQPPTFFTESSILTEESSLGSESTPLETTSVSLSESTQKETSGPLQTEEPSTFYTESSTVGGSSSGSASTPLVTTSVPQSESTQKETSGPFQTEEPSTFYTESSTTGGSSAGSESTPLETTSVSSSEPIEKETTDPSQTDGTITESSETTPEKSSPVEGTTPSVTTDPSKIFPPSQSSGSQSPSFKPETVYSIVPESILQPLQYNQPYQIFNRSRRAIRNSRAAPDSYHCYSINIIDGDRKRVQKGCVRVPEEKSACDVLKTKFGDSFDKCKICTMDRCNSSSTLKYSFITLVVVLVVSFLLKI